MPERLDPQMAAAIARHEELTRAHPAYGSLEVDDLRARAQDTWVPFNANPPALFDVRDTTVEGPFRQVPVRVYQPTEAARNGPAIFYVHGGGWFSCSLDTHDWAMRQLALDSGMIVIGVDPARAPEFKFPKPVQELAAVFGRIGQDAEAFGIDPTRLAFAGCSSGANMALGATFMMRQAFFRAGALFCGIFGTGKNTASARAFGDGRFGVTREEISWCFKQYLGAPGDKFDPRATPILGDLGRLPPMFLAAAELDPLSDDTLDLADRLVDCNVRCEARVYKGLTHNFMVYAGVVDGVRTSIWHAAGHIRREFFEPRPRLVAEFPEVAANVR